MSIKRINVIMATREPCGKSAKTARRKNGDAAEAVFEKIACLSVGFGL